MRWNTAEDYTPHSFSQDIYNGADILTIVLAVVGIWKYIVVPMWKDVFFLLWN